MIGSFEIAPMRTPLPSTRWLTCPRPAPSAPLRLWCLPFAGGGAAVWHPWAALLAGTAEIVALRPPGRENRLSETPFARLREMIPALVEQLAPFAHEDYALCGHSLGGLVAFELAHALRARGLGSPRALIVCGVRAPHHAPDEPWLHGLPRDPFIAQVERRYGPIPPEIRARPEILDLLLPVLRADLEVYETYRYAASAPLPIPLLALGGQDDGNVSPAQLLDWRSYTTGRFETALLEGGHFFPQENLRPTVDRVRSFLEACLGPGDLAPKSSAATSARAAETPSGQHSRLPVAAS